MKYIATIIFCVIVPASYNFNDQNRWKTRELRSKLKSDAASLYRPISHEDEFLVRVEALRNYLKGYEPFGMSGTVLIAKDQKVVLHEAYGFADKLKGIKSDRNTVYDIASVGKQFTATAILKLQEANKLKVSARIGRYLTAVPEDKRAITIHQLLTHTSGLVDPDSDAAIPAGRDAAVRSILKLPLANTPGSNFEYSNAGYSLLAAIVEIASGQTFENYLRMNLLRPAGLTRTSFVSEPVRHSGYRVAQSIGGYEGRFRSADPRDRPATWMNRGSGGILSNVGDLYRWERALLSGKFVSPQTLKLLYKPYTVAEADFLSYGYGWRIQKTERNTTLVWHTGWEEAFSSVYRRYVEEGVLVLFTSNQALDLVPMREIVLRSAREGVIGEILFGKGSPPLLRTRDIPRELSQRIGGRYRLDSENAFVISANRGKITITPEGQRAVEALEPKALSDKNPLAERNQRALLLMERLRSPNSRKDELEKKLDPYDYAGVGPDDLRTEWRSLESTHGKLRRVESLGTAHAGFPGRQRAVTMLRFQFEDGNEADYRLIWFADDELYLLNGAAASFHKTLRWTGGLGFAHLDLLRSEWLEFTFEEHAGKITSLSVRRADKTFTAYRIRKRK